MKVSLKFNWVNRENRFTAFTIFTFLLSIVNFSFAISEQDSPYCIVGLLFGLGLLLYYNFPRYFTNEIKLIFASLLIYSAYLIYIDTSNQFLVAGVSGQVLFLLYLHIEFKHDRTVFFELNQHMMTYYAVYTIYITSVAITEKLVQNYWFLLYVFFLTVAGVICLANIPKIVQYYNRKSEPFAQFITRGLIKIIPDKNIEYHENLEDNIVETVRDVKADTLTSNIEEIFEVKNSQPVTIQDVQEKIESSLTDIINTSSEYRNDISLKIEAIELGHELSVAELQGQINEIHSTLTVMKGKQELDFSNLLDNINSFKISVRNNDCMDSIKRIENVLVPAIFTCICDLSNQIVDSKTDHNELKTESSILIDKFNNYAEFIQNSIQMINRSIIEVQKIIDDQPKYIDLNKYKINKTERKILKALVYKQGSECDEESLDTYQAIADKAECSVGSIAPAFNKFSSYGWIENDWKENNSYCLINNDIKFKNL